MQSRGASQSAFAREAQALGYDYTQSSVLRASEEGWEDLGLAFAYGQRLPVGEDLEDIREFREFYTALCNKY